MLNRVCRFRENDWSAKPYVASSSLPRITGIFLKKGYSIRTVTGQLQCDRYSLVNDRPS
jgi:hypothetical protein